MPRVRRPTALGHSAIDPSRGDGRPIPGRLCRQLRPSDRRRLRSLFWKRPRGSGIDTKFHYLTERLTSAADDHLALGDCNLIYRFAQSPRGQMRMQAGSELAQRLDADRSRFQLHLRRRLLSPQALGSLGGDRLGNARPCRSVPLPHDRRRDLEPVREHVGYEYLDIGTTPGQLSDRRRPRVVLMPISQTFRGRHVHHFSWHSGTCGPRGNVPYGRMARSINSRSK